MRLTGLSLAGLIALSPGPALACALELILAIDVSGSINSEEYGLQMGGLARALEDEAVAKAVESLDGGMLVVVTQWSGMSRQAQTTNWQYVTGAAGLAALAATVREMPRAWDIFSTGIGEALTHAREVSATAPGSCRRRVIDVSGDGISNEGRPPAAVAQSLAAEGYIVNGLVIRGAEPDPVAHYETDVIAGPGAFVEVAADFHDYERAIRKKLLREIDPPQFVAEAQMRAAIRTRMR